ncbi:MAG: LysR family transcriptional regulator [Pseudomonas sp.]
MDRLRAIEIFIRASDAGSFYRAAELLSLTPQAVSKAIRQLEIELGLSLFHRDRRKSTLTEEGRAFLQRVRPGVEAVGHAWERARDSTTELAGLIRVTAPLGVGRRLIVPLMTSFLARHPHVELDLVAEDRHTDMVIAGIDVGFRCGVAPHGHFTVRELMRSQLIVCASPAYLQRRGVPATRSDLSNHACIGSRRPNTGRVTPWEFGVCGVVEHEPVSASFCTNDVGTEVEAALDGMGIAQVDGIIAARHLRSGRLVPLLCDQVSERFGVYLYHAPRPDMTGRVQGFIDHAVTHFSNNSERFRVEPDELATLHQAFLARRL